MGNKRRSFRLSDDEYAALRRVSEHYGVEMSTFVRDYIVRVSKQLEQRQTRAVQMSRLRGGHQRTGSGWGAYWRRKGRT